MFSEKKETPFHPFVISISAYKVVFQLAHGFEEQRAGTKVTTVTVTFVLAFYIVGLVSGMVWLLQLNFPKK